MASVNPKWADLGKKFLVFDGEINRNQPSNNGYTILLNGKKYVFTVDNDHGESSYDIHVMAHSELVSIAKYISDSNQYLGRVFDYIASRFQTYEEDRKRESLERFIFGS
jgi:hypothetical protein